MKSEAETVLYRNLEIIMLTTGMEHMDLWQRQHLCWVLKDILKRKRKRSKNVLMKTHNLLSAYQVLDTVVGMIRIPTHLLLTKTLGDGYHYYPPFCGVRDSSIER